MFFKKKLFVFFTYSRSYMISGGNSGIGFVTAMYLAKKGMYACTRAAGTCMHA